MNTLKQLAIAGILLTSGCAGFSDAPGYAGGRLLPHEIVTAPIGEVFTLSRSQLEGVKCPRGYWMYVESPVGIDYQAICLPREQLDDLFDAFSR